MQLKKEPVFRKAEKEDFPVIREFIRRNYRDRWEVEESHTEKRLTRFLFYRYMTHRDTVTVAVYRDQVVGVLITGKNGQARPAPIFRLKKGYQYFRLKLTKEGRKNLEHLVQIREMQQKLTPSGKKSLLFFYVSKEYRRNGIGTGLLKQVSDQDTCFLYMDQMDHRTFMEDHGFAKQGDVSQMRELNKKRFRENIALYQYMK